MGGIATLTERMINNLSSAELVFNCVNVAHKVNKRSNKITKNKKMDQIRILCHTIKSVFYQCLRRQCDVIHINSSSGNGTIRDYYIEKIANLFNVPVILHYHCNLEFAVNNSKIAKKYYTKCFELAKQIIVLNKSSQEFVRNNNFDARIIPNGIPEDLVATKHCINDNIQKAIFTGRVSINKGCLEIYECAKAYPQIDFYLAGLIDSVVEEKLKSLNNIFLLGSLSHEEVIERLDNADIFLFPTHSEGFSISLLEAMARGVPCVTTNVGANREMLEDKGGIIVEPKNSKAIINAIECLLPRNTREEMSAWNINKVMGEYTENKMFESFISVYKSVLNNA